VAIVIPAEGEILGRVLDSSHSISPEGMSRHAYRQFDSAQLRTAWGRHHQQRFALMEGDDLLASAVQYEFAAVLDQQPVRICGIGSIFSEPAYGDGEHAQSLIDGLLDRATRGGAAMALLFCDDTAHRRPNGFEVVPTIEVEITVTESSRHGAPMALIRGGEERDLAAIVAMGQIRATPFRLHVDRDVDFVHYVITRKRLLAGLGTSGTRQLHFFIAEEGITAAAYVVISIVGDAWTIEECGDRDPSGARVGAILQALIAREPVERRPTSRAWLPPGFVPPQIKIVSAKPSTEVMMVRSLRRTPLQLRLSGEEVLYWRSDIF
jgi:hypothetical protein